MLTLMHHHAHVHSHPFSSLETLLAEPFPHTPQEMLQLEQRLSTAAAQTADQMVLVQLTRAHEAEAFVTQAIAHARAQSPVPLVHKGFRMTSVLLLGGTRIVIETPYLREDREVVNLAPCGRTFLVHYVPDAPPMRIGHDGQRIRDERLGLTSAVLPA